MRAVNPLSPKVWRLAARADDARAKLMGLAKRLLVALAALWIAAVPLRAAEPDTKVLFLIASHPYVPAFVAQDTALREALAQNTTRRFQFFSETLDAQRFTFAEFEQEFLALLARKYRGMKIDVIVAVTRPALVFATKHRNELWPGAQLLFHSVSASALEGISLPERTFGVMEHRSIGRTVDLARRLQPNAQRIVVVGGVSDYDNDIVAETRAVLAARPDLPQTHYLIGLPQTELVELIAKEPATSIVLYLSQFRDRDGNPYPPRDVMRAMSTVSSAPVYGLYETMLGYGLAAGVVESFGALGRLVAERLVQLAAGTPIPAFSEGPNLCQADARALRKWSLDERNLPEGCEIRFAEFSLWREYRLQILGALAVVLFQAALIAWLLFERQRRLVAEEELRRRLLEVIHLNRTATATALSASIAHELNQPLGAILSYAEAAELYLKADPPNNARVEQILANIRRDDNRAAEIIRHFRGLVKKTDAVELQEFDVNDVVRHACDILHSEASKRGVSLTANHAEGAFPVRADHIQLQQVILNLAVNGMDAMQNCVPGTREMSIQTGLAGKSRVEVLVADSGTGIPAEKLNEIFETFYTTKRSGTGLGLSIARTIVETYGGRIWAENRPGGGAVFRFTLPLVSGLSAQ